MSRKRYTKRQDIFVLPDTFWRKYPSLDTVWYNTDRNRLEIVRFKTIFAFAGSFCRFKILGRVLDHNRDTIGLFSLTHLCGKLRCAQKWIIHFGSNQLCSKMIEL